MKDTALALILLIVCSSLKSLFFYTEIGLDYYHLLLHQALTLSVSTILVLVTLKSRSRIWFVSCYLLNVIILFVNADFFEFYGKFLHLSNMYILFPEAMMLAKNYNIPFDSSDLIYVIDFPLFLYLFNRHKKNEIMFGRGNLVIRISAGVAAVAGVILITIPVHYNSETMSTLEDYNTVSRYGIFGHNVSDLLARRMDRRADAIKYGPEIVSNKTSGKRPNIILIQVESLDANIVNYRYQGEYVTPFLHKLTTKSLYFPFTLCYRHYGGTSDCEIVVNNGIEPLADFPLMKVNSYDYPNSVVKVLKKNGYSAEAFHGNYGYVYTRSSAYLAMGYDNFFDIRNMHLKERGWGAPDQEVTSFVEARLQKVKTPFLASVITFTSHEPFNNFSHFEHDNRFNGVEPALTRNYFSSIAYTDRVLEKFVTDIQKKYPDTYFFLYGDHTPYVINSGPFRRSTLSDGGGMEMVPLYIVTPDGRSHRENGGVASYLDIAPTILHAAGVPYSYRSLGVDLLTGISLRQKVSFRGELYDRSELFEEMTEAL